MSIGREYPEAPIPGVGAVVLRGVPGMREVLLIRRGSEPMAGGWSLPGGAVELGETAAAACAREVREETGLAVEVIEPIDAVDIILRDDETRVRFHYLIVDMLCRQMNGELQAAAQAADDAMGACWAPVADVLERHAFSLTPRACKVIEKALHRFEEFS